VSDFLNSWALFGQAYGLTLLVAATLGLVGVVALARRQAFMAAAVAQTSILGYAATLMATGGVGGWLVGGPAGDFVVVASALAAAAMIMLSRTEQQHGSRLDGEERTAWVFIVATAGSILLLAHAPSGMEQFRRMQASSVIGASTNDLIAFALLLTVLSTLALAYRRPLVLWLTDPVMAAAVGMKTGRWNLALTGVLGCCIGLAVPAAGVVFTFGCLVLPVMIAKQFFGEVRLLLIASPIIGAGGAIVGLALAYIWNLPPGQVVVVLLGGAMAVAVGFRVGWEKLAY